MHPNAQVERRTCPYCGKIFRVKNAVPNHAANYHGALLPYKWWKNKESDNGTVS